MRVAVPGEAAGGITASTKSGPTAGLRTEWCGIYPLLMNRIKVASRANPATETPEARQAFGHKTAS